MQPKAPVDNYIIQLDKAFQDEITTPSGIKLFIDTKFSPEWNTTVTGRIVSLPQKLSSRPELRGRVIEGAEGEEVIISYMVVFDGDHRENDTFIHNNLFFYNGEWYWKCDTFAVLGFIRDGKLIPAQGYVFLEALEEPKEEKIGLIWLPESVVKEKPKGRAKVIGVGANKTCDPKLGIAEGDVVRYPDKFAQKYEVHGKNIIILDQSRILAKETK
jgi:co-chaperonin GroES (HSP10)